MNNLSPKAEPITYGIVIAGIVAALASYGFNITTELKDLIVLVGPFVLAMIASRFTVYAPDTVQRIADEQYTAGTPPTDPQPEVPSPARPPAGPIRST